MANVIFKTGTRAQYDALVLKDANTLYWLTDTQELMKGDVLFSKGTIANETSSGLMSAEDKAKLDVLPASCISGLTAVDESLLILDNEDGGKSIGVKVSQEPGNMIAVRGDGLFAGVEAIEIGNVTGLEDRLTKIEQSVIGGVHYKGSVPTAADLPSDAVQGDLYEVAEDNSEWCFNGKEWFEYGHTVDFSPIAGSGIEVDGRKVSVKIADESHGLVAVDGALSIALATKDFDGAMSKEDKAALDKLVALDIPTAYGKAYEISNKPTGTLVNYNGKEIRVMCPSNTEWALQNVGEGGDSNRYYIGFRAYAPSADVVSFKESLSTTMTDQTMYYFVDNEFAGIDANGRKYSIVWLPVAKHNDDGTWTYYGASSTYDKFIGWHYCVEWYNASGICVASDLIRINLANEDCVRSVEPYYMSGYVTDVELESALADISAAMSWEEL